MPSRRRGRFFGFYEAVDDVEVTRALMEPRGSGFWTAARK